MDNKLRVCFVWVNYFRNLENVSYNFSGRRKFAFDPQTSILSELSFERTPKDFFGSKITDVIGLIGQNGAGKSNSLQLICNALKGGNKFINSSFLVVTESEEGLTCHYSFPNLEVPKMLPKGKVSPYKDISPLKVIYFSNVFDNRQMILDKDVSDISVNRFSYKYFGARDEPTEFLKQVNFINSTHFINLDIEIPEGLLVRFTIWQKYLDYKLIPRDLEKALRKYRTWIRKLIRFAKEEEKFSGLLRFGFFLDVVNTVYQQNIAEYDFKDNLIDFLEERIPDLLGETFRLLDILEREIMPNIEEKIESRMLTDKNPPWVFRKIKEQFEFLSKLDALDFLSASSVEGTNRNSSENFAIPYSRNKNRTFIKKFVDLFEDEIYLNINWLGISSGQKAYLNLFASIYHEIRGTRTENILLCIDEGDLYLHPKWQVEFFEKLITVLPKIYKGNLQLILTSHSPFLLSDLPKQNICLISYGKTIDGINLKKKTFGGNLYNLYSEPFFLGSQRTSNFASNKIEDVLRLLEHDSLSKNDKKKIEELLSILGDELLQFRLERALKDD